MAEETKKKSRKPRPRPTRGVSFQVWSVNGSPVSDKIVAEIESSIERITLLALNDGHRLLTQTARG